MSSVRITNLSHALPPNLEAPTVALTIGDTATTLATAGLTLHENTRYVLITVEEADVRMCPEGTPPTADLGHPVPQDTQALFARTEVINGKWIRAGAIDATLQVSQYTA